MAGCCVSCCPITARYRNVVSDRLGGKLDEGSKARPPLGPTERAARLFGGARNVHSCFRIPGCSRHGSVRGRASVSGAAEEDARTLETASSFRVGSTPEESWPEPRAPPGRRSTRMRYEIRPTWHQWVRGFGRHTRRRRWQTREKLVQLTPAGPHSEPSLTSADATPGTGALPPAGPSDDPNMQPTS